MPIWLLTDIALPQALRVCFFSGITVISAIPQRIRYEILKIPISRQHNLQKVIAVNCPILNRLIIGVDDVTVFIGQRAIAGMAVGTLLMSKRPDVLEYLFVRQGHLNSRRGKACP